MQIFRRESALVDPVRTALRRRGYRRQRLEVPFYEYSMDVYGYAASARKTIAVELKLAKLDARVLSRHLFTSFAPIMFTSRCLKAVHDELINHC